MSIGFATPAPAIELGEVRGRIGIDVDGLGIANAGPIAVFLEPLGHNPPRTQNDSALIRQQDARFIPAFTIVSPGQTIVMPNEDPFYHNVFSYAQHNDFDLGLYPQDDERSVKLEHPGVVPIYCAIHESMRGIIVVAPSPWFDRADASGAFHIEAVPVGRYRLETFSEVLPALSREIIVKGLETTVVELNIREATSR
jgi:plastocyanin